MKLCPTCKRSFDDDSLSFCLDDGTPLVNQGSGRADATTLVTSTPTQSYGGAGKETIQASQLQTPYTPQSGPPARKRKAWPWIVGLLLVLVIGVVGVVALAVLAPALMKTSVNENQRPSPTPTPARVVINDSPKPAPSESASETTENAGDEAPTDKEEVLTALTRMEQRWTAANIKGDKAELEEILADDYVGGVDSHNKREYLAKLNPESGVISWELKNLGVQQNGNRATVHGILTEVTKAGKNNYEFNDRFVWRNGRWQATGSDTTRVK